MIRVCTICARGGSKGVPGKNLRFLHGRPLIGWTIQQAKNSQLFDVISVSSDSDSILETAQHEGADFLVKRPDELAADSAGKIPAIKHCLLEAEKKVGCQADTIVDLDVTSPLRTVDDIKAVVELLESSSCNNVITGSPSRRSPYFNLVELNDKGFAEISKVADSQILRRQDTPACFDMNASIYAWRRDVFVADPKVFYERTKIYAMPESRSIDIDSELDFDIVEMLLSRFNKEGKYE